jgi:hypothetical protein
LGAVEAQLSVELPITRNGALLREGVLTLLRDRLTDLAAAYGGFVRRGWN